MVDWFFILKQQTGYNIVLAFVIERTLLLILILILTLMNVGLLVRISLQPRILKMIAAMAIMPHPQATLMRNPSHTPGSVKPQPAKQNI